MSGSCCGGSPKTELTKVAMTAAPQTTEAATEQPAAKFNKSESCSDNPARSENLRGRTTHLPTSHHDPKVLWFNVNATVLQAMHQGKHAVLRNTK
jgi:hypothetical protein